MQVLGYILFVFRDHGPPGGCPVKNPGQDPPNKKASRPSYDEMPVKATLTIRLHLNHVFGHRPPVTLFHIKLDALTLVKGFEPGH